MQPYLFVSLLYVAENGFQYLQFKYQATAYVSFKKVHHWTVKDASYYSQACH